MLVILCSVLFCNRTIAQTNDSLIIDRLKFQDQLHGFWLGTCIANWTGLITEMDKVGNVGEIKTGDFYTMKNWGKADHPSIWGEGMPSSLSPVIDFIYAKSDSIWGADDDTDIEYIYHYLMKNSDSPFLSGEAIRNGWLNHIKAEEENYLWVSNQTALDLMKRGVIPPNTGDSSLNIHNDMIDAQLTTELFGLMAPGRPDIAHQLSDIPIRMVARGDAAHIAQFYITMFSLAPLYSDKEDLGQSLFEMAEIARENLPNESYSAAMYDYVKMRYQEGVEWEILRDEIYQRYQVEQMDGYNITSRNLYCNGCFAAGINFAASLISLFYGDGDIVKTIKLGTLMGWDSDNPTATWGGLIGFMIGKEGIEDEFQHTFSENYHIHRTRQNFPNQGIDTFSNMAKDGLLIVDKIVNDIPGAETDRLNNLWIIPVKF